MSYDEQVVVPETGAYAFGHEVVRSALVKFEISFEEPNRMTAGERETAKLRQIATAGKLPTTSQIWKRACDGAS